MAQFTSGDLFAGRYQFQQHLYSGEYSEVWTATDPLTHDALIVLKIFLAKSGFSEHDLETFRRDAVTVVPLEQDNLLKPLHFDVVDRMPYLVLPYCEHGSFADQMAEKPPQLTETMLVKLLEEIGSALAYLHERVPPMPHGSLTPHDILISDEGHYLLADYWRSRELIALLEKSRGAQGKPPVAYLPPEARGDDAKVSTAGDIFALGVILSQLASGVLPGAGSAGASLPELPGHFSSGFRELLLRCLDDDPELRPSANELVRWAKWSLQVAATGSGTSAKPSALQEGAIRNRPSRSTNTSLLRWAGTAVALVALVVGGIGAAGYLYMQQSVHSAAVEKILRFHGSNTIGAELVPRLAEEFLHRQGAFGIMRIPLKEDEMLIRGKMKDNSSREIEIFAHGSATAFQDLGKGVCDVGDASRRVKNEEQATLHDLGDMTSPACEHVLALDGIAVIVQQDNPLQELSKETVARIFDGEVTDWSKLGRSAGPIHVYARDDKSGTYDTFKNLVLGDKRKLVPTAERFESNEQLRQTVSTDPNGIGFASISFVKGVKALAISDGPKAITPSAFTVSTEDYPLSRRLFFYTPAQSPNKYVQEFIEFALSKDGQEIANQVGFVG